MFEQGDNVFAESSVGFKMKRITYKESKLNAILRAKKLKAMLGELEKGACVGLYMANNHRFIECFWAILACGFNPVLLNTKFSNEQIEKVLVSGSVKAVVSDSKEFSLKTLKIDEVDGFPSTADLDCWGEEVYFTSSGTSDNVKLCAYTAESFINQISNSMAIMKNCPQIESHYKGELKLLALLPFYHVFGFIAVYIWFGFFARTFVFLLDFTPQTLLKTVKKHDVTHIFAVPMVWETIYKQAIKKIKALGDKEYNKFNKALTYVNNHERLGTAVSKSAFKEVRQGLFGESIRFLISGGSAISENAMKFFNGIGYFTVNGYGMTELGITSVETSKKRRERNLCSIGAPFGSAEYKINDNGELLVKTNTRAVKIIKGNEVTVSNLNEWFNTKDIALIKGGRCYLLGRSDDVIISSSGENINPQTVEDAIKIEEIAKKSLVKSPEGAVLVLQANSWLPSEKVIKIKEEVIRQLKAVNVETEVKKIVITKTKLLAENDFKVSRAKVSKRLQNLELELLGEDKKQDFEEVSELDAELIKLLKGVIGEGVEVSATDEFFSTLNISSLEYFEFILEVKERYNLKANAFEGNPLTTVKQISAYIMEELK